MCLIVFIFTLLKCLLNSPLFWNQSVLEFLVDFMNFSPAKIKVCLWFRFPVSMCLHFKTNTTEDKYDNLDRKWISIRSIARLNMFQ